MHNSKKWVGKQSDYKCASIRHLAEMPVGPYLVCSQFDEDIFKGMGISEVNKKYSDKLVAEIPYKGCPGVVAFYFNEKNKLELCFAHYDSSD